MIRAFRQPRLVGKGGRRLTLGQVRQQALERDHAPVVGVRAPHLSHAAAADPLDQLIASEAESHLEIVARDKSNRYAREA